MLKQLMKNAEDLENLDKLLDSSNKSYSDSKSKKSSLEINFLFRYGQFGSGTVFFATPCSSNGKKHSGHCKACVYRV